MPMAAAWGEAISTWGASWRIMSTGRVMGPPYAMARPSVERFAPAPPYPLEAKGFESDI